MRQPESQDNLDIFLKALEHDALDWETYFHLDTDQKETVNQELQKYNITSSNSRGKYEVLVGIRGIVPASRPPIYFTTKIIAESLKIFYEGKGKHASIKKHF